MIPSLTIKWMLCTPQSKLRDYEHEVARKRIKEVEWRTGTVSAVVMVMGALVESLTASSHILQHLHTSTPPVQ